MFAYSEKNLFEIEEKFEILLEKNVFRRCLIAISDRKREKTKTSIDDSSAQAAYAASADRTGQAKLTHAHKRVRKSIRDLFVCIRLASANSSRYTHISKLFLPHLRIIISSSKTGDVTRRNRFYDEKRNEFFFDRNREAFEGILHFYQSGGAFEVPLFVPVDVFYEELRYFDLINYLDSTSYYSDENLLICALKNQLIELNKQYADCQTPQLEKEFRMKKKSLKEKFVHLKVRR